MKKSPDDYWVKIFEELAELKKKNHALVVENHNLKQQIIRLKNPKPTWISGRPSYKTDPNIGVIYETLDFLNKYDLHNPKHPSESRHNRFASE